MHHKPHTPTMTMALVLPLPLPQLLPGPLHLLPSARLILRLPGVRTILNHKRRNTLNQRSVGKSLGVDTDTVRRLHTCEDVRAAFFAEFVRYCVVGEVVGDQVGVLVAT